MHTSILILAFAALGQPVQTPASGPIWHKTYAQGLEAAAKQKKVLAMFIGAGGKGAESATTDGLSEEIRHVLAKDYVCVLLDTGESRADTTIKALNITQGSGVVLSDRSLTLQALRFDGKIAQKDLLAHLQHFANPATEVTTTVTNNIQRTSFYPNGTFQQQFNAAPRTTQNC